MKLTVQNAEIQTATVEVKTLTISGKQVTLAVFRQLQEQAWLDNAATPHGPAWGTVNYHPDKCADGPTHQHVVWQDGTDLRRCRLLRYPWDGQQFYEELVSDRAVETAFCRASHRWGNLAWIQFQKDVDGELVPTFIVDGIQCDALEPPGSHACQADPQKEFEEAWADLRTAVAAEKARRDRWRAAYESAGPQLFIAV